MAWASNEVVDTLMFLLPGFVATALFYAFTSHPRPSAFEHVIRALIFTAIVQAVTGLLFLSWGWFSDTGETWRQDPIFYQISSFALAVLFGMGFSFCSNRDIPHKLFRRLEITKETSYSSEWYSIFSRYGDEKYVVLHLQDGRRLYGYAKEWPSNPADGYFLIAEAEWLESGEGWSKSGENPCAKKDVLILISTTEINMVEFRV